MAQAGDTTSGGIRRRLHATLALLPVDPTQVEYLVDRLLQEDAPPRPDELIVIRKALFDTSHAELLKPQLWVLLEKNREELNERQFRAAGTLALFAPQDPRWPALSQSVAAKLVRENLLLIGAWREVFQPVYGVLLGPLRAIYGDRSHPEQRERAASLLFEFAIQPDNPHPTEDLVELIGEADLSLFRRILDTIPERTRAVALLAAKLDGPARFDDVGYDLRLMSSLDDVSGIPREGKNLIIVAAVNSVLHFRIFDGDGEEVVGTDEKRLTDKARQIEDLRKQLESLWPPHELTRSEKDRVITAVTSIVGHTHDVLARRQGQMATALALLGESERIWPLFKHTDDPSARTELIHDLARFGADSRLVIERLKTEPDVPARRALVLALGEYPTDQVPADDRQALVSMLLAWYRDDPEPGVHGGVDWLLRQKWDQARALDRIDEELSRVDLPGARDWHVNGQGQTFAVVRGPVEFLMGSPEGEVDRDPDEILHRVRIGRSFAIATRPVTVVQYARFLDQNPSLLRPDKNVHGMPFIPSPDCPIVEVDWYEAAKYCNWLSGREGIPEAQWCYPKKIGPGMTLPQDYLSRTGYRLPTEAEWEYACRAGSAAARYYGGSAAMLPKFGWSMENAGRRTHPTGQLKPNDLGLFDMLGNVWQWTQDHYDPYNRYQTNQGDWPVISNGTGPPVIDEEFTIVISDRVVRVPRGGSFFYSAPALRSALRTFYLPSFHHPSIGLRPARTVCSISPVSRQKTKVFLAWIYGLWNRHLLLISFTLLLAFP